MTIDWGLIDTALLGAYDRTRKCIPGMKDHT